MAFAAEQLGADALSARPNLAQILPNGGLIELSGDHATGRTSTAVSLVAEAQARGEVVAWIEPEGGSFYPPDVAASGVDLASLVVVHVPETEVARAAELLLRSGAFGLVVLDFVGEATSSQPRHFRLAWQSRLQALVRKHTCRLVVLTSTAADSPSLGAPVHLRVLPKRQPSKAGSFTVGHELLKSKAGLQDAPAPERWAAPAGVR